MSRRVEVTIERATVPTKEVEALLQELDQVLSGPYTREQRHALSIARLFQPHIRFFLARHKGEAVACGGVALLDGYAELKRMYSMPVVRGRGAARQILVRLEAEAREAAIRILRIETGVYQAESIRFYEAAGYRRRAAFGPYATMPAEAIATSLFFEKTLAPR